jgi:AraC-like DNA-binding protein/NAD(P)H-dependent FMN reductase
MTRPLVLVIGDCDRSERPVEVLLRRVEQELLDNGARVSLMLPDRPVRRAPEDGTEPHGVIVVARELHRSYSGTIKTLLDSLDAEPVAGKPFALMSYSESQPAATAVDHLRVVVSALQGVAIPAEVCASLSAVAGDRPGPECVDEDVAESIAALVEQLLHYSRRIAVAQEPERVSPRLVWSAPRTGFEPAQPVNGKIYKGIAEAVTYIKANYWDQNLSLDTVANVVFMSRYHFSRKFRQETGRRFIDYLIMLRMTEARKLLIDTNWTVTAIAAAVGYRDLSNFERSFKKLFGTQPSQYRLRYAGSTSDRVQELAGLRDVPAPSVARGRA